MGTKFQFFKFSSQQNILWDVDIQGTQGAWARRACRARRAPRARRARGTAI